MQRFWAFTVIVLGAMSAAAQTLTPREVFYGQGRPVATKHSATGTKPTTVKAASTSTVSSPAEVSQKETDELRTSASSEAQRVSVTKVSETIRPLGLKYTILKRGEAGDYTEADPDSSFVSGDRIRLTIETNDAGYLYVVAQGTSKVWKVLYPSAEVAGGSNRVQRGQRYSIPSDAVFSFDSHAGTEKLFVVLSRQPEPDLENLIYSLDKKQRDSAEPAHALLAANVAPVGDSLVEHLRTVYARDLVIEKVDDSKAPARTAEPVRTGAEAIPTMEKAVYVVNPKAGANARVVADVELRHE